MRRKRRVPVFPKIRITNLTNEVLYIGIRTKQGTGIYLAPSGQPGSSIDVEGLDLADEKVLVTLGNLYTTGKVNYTVLQTFTDALLSVRGVTTTTPPS